MRSPINRCSLLVALALSLLVAPVAHAVKDGDIVKYRAALRTIDPDKLLFLKANSTEGLVYVTVTDEWYNGKCWERDRMANRLSNLWRKYGGTSVVVEDRVGKTVADFKIFGGFKIAGCPDQ